MTVTGLAVARTIFRNGQPEMQMYLNLFSNMTKDILEEITVV